MISAPPGKLIKESIIIVVLKSLGSIKAKESKARDSLSRILSCKPEPRTISTLVAIDTILYLFNIDSSFICVKLGSGLLPAVLWSHFP